MNHGVIQQNESPEIIYNKPSNTFVADFIGSPSMNLIKGKLNESSDKISFTAEGANFDIPINSYDFNNTSEINNKEVYFGIRPEHIYIEKNASNNFEIKVKSELSEYIGHEQIITFDFSGQQLLGKFSSTIDIDINKEFNLNIDINQLSVFDTLTEERI